MSRVALIDMDITAYGAAHLADKVGEGLGKGYINKVFRKVLRITEADAYIGFLTHNSREDNFRKDIATIMEYKGHRTERPEKLAQMRDYCVTKWGAHIVTGMEADDAIGLQSEIQEDYVICSVDKDLRTIAGKHLIMHRSKDWEFIEISPYKALLNFYRQLLTGDSGDNIPGIKGIGPVKSFNLLKDCKTELEMLAVVKKVYYTHKYDDKRLLEVARLLHLLRKPITEDGSHLWTFPKQSKDCSVSG